MDPSFESEDQLKCFIECKQYVRLTLEMPQEIISNDKIIKFCNDSKNRIKDAKAALKIHAEYLTKINLKRVAEIPLSKYNFGKNNYTRRSYL